MTTTTTTKRKTPRRSRSAQEDFTLEEAAIMSMGNRIMSHEARDNFGVLSQRVTTLEAAFQEQRNAFNSLNSKIDEQARSQGEKIDTLFRTLDQRLSGQIDSITKQLSQQVDAVNEKVNASRIPNYAVILGFLGIAITIFGTVYTFVSTPLNKTLGEIQQQIYAERSERVQAVDSIKATLVPRNEIIDWRDGVRNALTAIRENHEKLRDSLVPRGEHERVWENYDNSLANLQRQLDDDELQNQREMDELKEAFGNTYSLRDMVLRMIERQDRADARLNELMGYTNPRAMQ